jgi:NADH-quinone oxidoreductase subunit N
MTIGNLIALVQKDVKRILGYSSIAHAGYILVAVLAHAKDPSKVGYEATVYYLLSYSLMTIGAFAVVSMSARSGREQTGLNSLNGLWKRSPLAAVALLVFMFSLVGIPPTAGFVGKLLIFNDALTSGMTTLAIALAINSILSIYYYVGIAKAAFVEEEEAAPSRPMGLGLASACALCAAGVVACAVFFTPITQLIGLR